MVQDAPQRRVNRGRDVLALTGLALLTAGAGFVYWPLALLVPGAVLFGAASWSYLKGR